LKSPTPDEDKPLSKRDEQRLLEAGKSVFSTAFPNPDRQGCPTPDLIRAIAYRKADPAQHRDFIVHMSQCSPCFNDFARFQEEAKRARRSRDLAVAAAAVLMIGLALFTWSERRQLMRPEGVQIATLDLTHRGILRSEEAGPPKPPLELSAGVLELTIYLPVGSEPGPYDLQILKQAAAPLWSGGGQAKSENQGVALRFKVDLSEAKPGSYFLAIRRRGWDWAYYPLAIR
jgi:hypothetical protein